jgi:hypothetical protein
LYDQLSGGTTLFDCNVGGYHLFAVEGADAITSANLQADHGVDLAFADNVRDYYDSQPMLLSDMGDSLFVTPKDDEVAYVLYTYTALSGLRRLPAAATPELRVQDIFRDPRGRSTVANNYGNGYLLRAKDQVADYLAENIVFSVTVNSDVPDTDSNKHVVDIDGALTVVTSRASVAGPLAYDVRLDVIDIARVKARHPDAIAFTEHDNDGQRWYNPCSIYLSWSESAQEPQAEHILLTTSSTTFSVDAGAMFDDAFMEAFGFIPTHLRKGILCREATITGLKQGYSYRVAKDLSYAAVVVPGPMIREGFLNMATANSWDISSITDELDQLEDIDAMAITITNSPIDPPVDVTAEMSFFNTTTGTTELYNQVLVEAADSPEINTDWTVRNAVNRIKGTAPKSFFTRVLNNVPSYGGEVTIVTESDVLVWKVDEVTATEDEVREAVEDGGGFDSALLIASINASTATASDQSAAIAFVNGLSSITQNPTLDYSMKALGSITGEDWFKAFGLPGAAKSQQIGTELVHTELDRTAVASPIAPITLIPDPV